MPAALALLERVASAFAEQNPTVTSLRVAAVGAAVRVALDVGGHHQAVLATPRFDGSCYGRTASFSFSVESAEAVHILPHAVEHALSSFIEAVRRADDGSVEWPREPEPAPPVAADPPHAEAEELPTDDLRATRAREIYVMVGFDCALRCSVCPFWGEHGISHHDGDRQWHRREIDLGALERFLTGMRPYQPQSLNVSGGEPLQSPVWVDVASLGKRLGYDVTLTTSGVGLLAQIDAVAAHVDTVNLSCTDPVELRRGLGTDDWPAAIGDALRALHAANPKVGVRLAYVVSNLSFPELEATVDRVHDLNLPIEGMAVVHPMFLDPATLDAHKAELAAAFGITAHQWAGFGTLPDQVDPEALLATLVRLRGRHPDLAVFPGLADDEIRPYYAEPGFLPPSYGGGCRAPWEQIQIGPDGRVWTCGDVVIGDIHESDAEGIWNGGPARALRARLLDDGLWAGCRGCFLKYAD